MTARPAAGWTCRRVTRTVACGHHNPPRTRKCQACGKPKPARRRPAHFRALDLTYAEFVELNGGNRCGICHRPPSWHRRLDRDHDHRTGQPRGLLCVRCNRALPNWVTAGWLRAAAAYLERPDTQ
jgi:hypothetical protein